MDYIIKNHKNVYICLSKNGKAETCTENDKGLFEYSKAQNIVKGLPKTLKRLNFKVEPIPDGIVHKVKETIKKERSKDIIVSTYYTVPDSITRWVERVRDCNGLAKEAAKRKEELINALSNADKELSNCLHEIEFTRWKNGCAGYKEYKSVKIILEKRRGIKDELSVVQSILSSNLESLATDRIEKVVKGLSNRVFNVREVQNYDDL